MGQMIHFVTGKGGVGKSTCALGMALGFADKGFRTLLVEVGSQSYFQKLLALQSIHYAPTPTHLGFDVALWDGPDCLYEYTKYLVKVPGLADLFLRNSVSRALIDVAPALKELALLGKITSHVRQYGPGVTHDRVIIDCPSTGHFLSLLRAPSGMIQVVSRGPMAEQSHSIQRSLQDKNQCQYHIVTLAEEMPLAESIELRRDLVEIVKMEPNIILNMAVEIPQNLPAADLNLFCSYLHLKKQQQEKAHSVLREQMQKFAVVPKTVVVPQVFSSDQMISRLKEVFR